MPIGCVSLVAPIIADIAPRRPARVLDAGIGLGFWGAALRQWLDQGTVRRTHLTGIEGFCDYRNPLWNAYDWVHGCTIEAYLAAPAGRSDRFDAILLLDVLEHWTSDYGICVLEQLQGRLAPGGRLYVGTPGVWMPQGAAWGNALEVHRSLWTADDLRGLGYVVLMDGTPDAVGNQMVLAHWTSA